MHDAVDRRFELLESFVQLPVATAQLGNGLLYHLAVNLVVVLVSRLHADTEDSRLDVVHATLLLSSLHLATHVHLLPQAAVTPLNAELHLATNPMTQQLHVVLLLNGEPCHRIKGLVQELADLVVHAGEVAHNRAVLRDLRVVPLIEHRVPDDDAAFVHKQYLMNFFVLVLDYVVLHIAPWLKFVQELDNERSQLLVQDGQSLAFVDDSEEGLVGVEEVAEQIVDVDLLHSCLGQLRNEPLISLGLECEQRIVGPIELEERLNLANHAFRERLGLVVLHESRNELRQLAIVSSELERVAQHQHVHKLGHDKREHKHANKHNARYDDLFNSTQWLEVAETNSRQGRQAKVPHLNHREHLLR